jgi:hypothetical protein
MNIPVKSSNSGSSHHPPKPDNRQTRHYSRGVSPEDIKRAYSAELARLLPPNARTLPTPPLPSRSDTPGNTSSNSERRASATGVHDASAELQAHVRARWPSVSSKEQWVIATLMLAHPNISDRTIRIYLGLRRASVPREGW